MKSILYFIIVAIIVAYAVLTVNPCDYEKPESIPLKTEYYDHHDSLPGDSIPGTWLRVHGKDTLRVYKRKITVEYYTEVINFKRDPNFKIKVNRK